MSQKKRCIECNGEFARRVSPSGVIESRREYENRKFCSVQCRANSTASNLHSDFWKHVTKTSECWIWNGSRYQNGYGHLTRRGKDLSAHRVSWEISNGRPIPKGLHVIHSCDNPPCVNPAHLSVGTRKENMGDCLRKGRIHAAKLTEDQVSSARKRLLDGESPSVLAKEMNISRSSVSAIKHGITWKHVRSAQ